MAVPTASLADSPLFFLLFSWFRTGYRPRDVGTCARTRTVCLPPCRFVGGESRFFPKRDCAQAPSDPGQRSGLRAQVMEILLPLRKTPIMGALSIHSSQYTRIVCYCTDRQASGFVRTFVGHDACAPPTLSECCSLLACPPLMLGCTEIFLEYLTIPKSDNRLRRKR